MSKTKSIAIIGGGIFGALNAIKLNEFGHNVTILERSEDLLKGASFNNQNRLHLGFHYPRDDETARQCIRGYDSFKKTFRSSILSDFGTGRSLKSGGISNGFFLITRNSSLFSLFFPVSPSFTFWQEYRNNRARIYRKKFFI